MGTKDIKQAGTGGSAVPKDLLLAKATCTSFSFKSAFLSLERKSKPDILNPFPKARRLTGKQPWMQNKSNPR